MSTSFKSVLIILLCLVAIAGIFSLVANFNFSGQVDDLNNRLNAAESWKGENEQLREENDALTAQIDELKQQLEELKNKRYLEDNQIVLTKHVVAQGETLTGICQQYGIEDAYSVDIILRLNNLSNPNSIPVGTELLLPTN